VAAACALPCRVVRTAVRGSPGRASSLEANISCDPVLADAESDGSRPRPVREQIGDAGSRTSSATNAAAHPPPPEKPGHVYKPTTHERSHREPIPARSGGGRSFARLDSESNSIGSHRSRSAAPVSVGSPFHSFQKRSCHGFALLALAAW